MAKVNGPLFSIDARGALADSIVFSVWKGINYVRQYVIPFNPKTVDQTAVRDAFASYVAHWKLLIAGDQTLWNDRVDELGYQMSGFNFYVQQCFEQGLDPDADPWVDPVLP